MVRKALGIGVVSALAAMMVVSLAMAQPGGGGGGRGGPGGGGGGMGGGMGGGRGMGMDPAARAQMILENIGITGDKAKAVEPLLVKVLQAEQQANAGRGRGGRGGRMGGGMGGPGGGAAAPETELAKARAALQTAVDNTSAKPEDVTKALTAYRAARQKAQADLAAAQAELKKVLTPGQEAQLVLQGVLE